MKSLKIHVSICLSSTLFFISGCVRFVDRSVDSAADDYSLSVLQNDLYTKAIEYLKDPKQVPDGDLTNRDGVLVYFNSDIDSVNSAIEINESSPMFAVQLRRPIKGASWYIFDLKDRGAASRLLESAPDFVSTDSWQLAGQGRKQTD